jgi:hypothetical protein
MGLHYFECKKLEKGMVIIFDYRLNQCYKAGDDLVLKFKGREMVVPHKELKKRALKLSRQIFQSQFGGGGNTYGIYHFKWVPTNKPKTPPIQTTIFDALKATEKEN